MPFRGAAEYLFQRKAKRYNTAVRRSRANQGLPCKSVLTDNAGEAYGLGIRSNNLRFGSGPG